MNSDCKYLIGSGFHPHQHAQWFYPIWLGNTLRYAKPRQVVVLADSAANCPEWHQAVQWVSMQGDLGHVYDLITGRKDFDWCGWSMTVCITALMAYFNECDYIHKEQDALAFGPWVEKIYEEAGENKNVMVGSAANIPVVQSIFWVRHHFIPEFVRIYLGTGNERTEDQFGELKFKRLEEKYSNDFGRYSFGFDRERPLRLTDPVFYAQQITPSELEEMERAGLLNIPGSMPRAVNFSGCAKV
jgi:hypothetical protein